MQDTITEPTEKELAPLEAVVWFNEFTELRRVSPHVATNSDSWVVIDNSLQNDEDSDTVIVGMALVEPEDTDSADATLHRIAVKPSHQNQGIASNMVAALHDEYGSLELTCRESLPANEFYEHTGWERVGVAEASPENLIQWRRTPTTRDNTAN